MSIGSHLGWRVGVSHIILNVGQPKIISAQLSLAEDFNAFFFLKISITDINQKKDKFPRKKQKKY